MAAYMWVCVDQLGRPVVSLPCAPVLHFVTWPLELVEDPTRDRFADTYHFCCMWLPSLSAMGRKLPLQHFVVESIISMREDFAGDFYKPRRRIRRRLARGETELIRRRRLRRGWVSKFLRRALWRHGAHRFSRWYLLVFVGHALRS
jgi:hypothetical protein